VAYDLYSLENETTDAGIGCYGELSDKMEELEFLKSVSSVFSARGVRYSGLSGRKIRKVALCGGSGSSLLNDAIAVNADAFITSDIKYHTFLETGSKILIADIGHYESEKFSAGILYDLIIKKFPTFAVRFSEINTNPINYL
jgi:putative NIF3 family GTP cyclohydrolase 1 type 2